MIKYYNEFNKFVKDVSEGLIKTYPIKTANRLIERELSNLKVQFKTGIDYDTNTLFIKCLSQSIVIDNIIKILTQINSCGYFISHFDFYDTNDKNINSIKYEPLSKDYTELLEENINNSYYIQITTESKFNKLVDNKNIYYHVTETKNVDKILKIGLLPRSMSKKTYHSDRIYIGKDLINVKGLARQFNDGDYTLLKITLENDDIKLYDDPDFSGYGVYTYENISPKYIKTIEDFSVKNGIII